MEKGIKLASLKLKEELHRESRPSWESSNEGIHERVNFEDTLWGFNLAGGIHYNTPLRITQVKENSRASHAGIKVGDILQSINDLDTSTLTVEEAHRLILESGLGIKLVVAAPDVEETTHYVYEDEIEQETRERKRLDGLKAERERKKFNGARTNDAWSLAWPCSKKRDIMYRESNCFLVASKFVAKQERAILSPKEPNDGGDTSNSDSLNVNGTRAI